MAVSYLDGPVPIWHLENVSKECRLIDLALSLSTGLCHRCGLQLFVFCSYSVVRLFWFPLFCQLDMMKDNAAKLASLIKFRFRWIQINWKVIKKTNPFRIYILKFNGSLFFWLLFIFHCPSCPSLSCRAVIFMWCMVDQGYVQVDSALNLFLLCLQRCPYVCWRLLT